MVHHIKIPTAVWELIPCSHQHTTKHYMPLHLILIELPKFLLLHECHARRTYAYVHRPKQLLVFKWGSPPGPDFTRSHVSPDALHRRVYWLQRNKSSCHAPSLDCRKNYFQSIAQPDKWLWEWFHVSNFACIPGSTKWRPRQPCGNLIICEILEFTIKEASISVSSS